MEAENVGKIPLRVHNVEIEGNTTTKSDFLEAELRRAGVFEARTLEEVSQALKAGVERAKSRNILSSLVAELNEGPWDGTTTVRLLAKDKDIKSGRLFARAQVMHTFKTGENTLDFQTQIKNLLGRAESLEANTSVGERSGTSFTGTFRKPCFHGTKELQLSAFRTSSDFSLTSSYAQLSRGLRTVLSTEDGMHQVGWEGDWRDISVADRTNVGSIRRFFQFGASERASNEQPSLGAIQSASSSVKSALTYVFSLNRLRQSQLIPHAGYALKLKTEVAGMGGDVNHQKFEANAKYYFPMSTDITFGLSVSGGILASLLSGQDSHICDRFFLGGPHSVRGYKMNAVGPRDGNDALGGDGYVAGSVELTTKIPGALRQLGMCLHLFGNAGSLIATQQSKRDLPTIAAQLQDGLRLSAGFGVVLPTPFGRFELNYTVPIGTEDTSIIDKLQFGLGFDWI